MARRFYVFCGSDRLRRGDAVYLVAVISNGVAMHGLVSNCNGAVQIIIVMSGMGIVLS